MLCVDSSTIPSTRHQKLLTAAGASPEFETLRDETRFKAFIP